MVDLSAPSLAPGNVRHIHVHELKPMPAGLVDYFLRTVPVAQVLTNIAQLTVHDRYQASLGIEAAAAFVAEEARRAGLEQITIDRFRADGEVAWWSFRAPTSWTPVTARLTIRDRNLVLLAVDHARQPFAIATYSAETPEGGITRPLVAWPGRSRSDLAGAFVLVPREAMPPERLIPELISAGAIGYATDAAAPPSIDDVECRGRIELDSQTPLVVFSLTSGEMARARAAALVRAAATIEVAVDRSATMPVVSAVLPGDRDGEIWLTSHLCHPRPGANDNASGVAALLGIGAAHAAARRVHAGWRTERTIRFLWGPEFLAVAAIIHRAMAQNGRAGLPAAVINLDMVGENQARCGSPFIVERGPDWRPALLDPLAEAVVANVFARTRESEGRWHSVPFAGFSDHALFADRNVRVPAVQLSHVPDRFNHSDADTLDKVCPIELRRSLAAGAALAQIAADDSVIPADQRAAEVEAWCHRQRAIAAAIAGADDDWGHRFCDHVARHTAAMTALAAGISPEMAATMVVKHDPEDGQPFSPRWSGPFNARAMLADLSTPTRAAVNAAIRADKANLALILNLAHAVDGIRSRARILRDTSFTLRRRLDTPTATRLFDALVESGWVAESH